MRGPRAGIISRFECTHLDWAFWQTAVALPSYVSPGIAAAAAAAPDVGLNNNNIDGIDGKKDCSRCTT